MMQMQHDTVEKDRKSGIIMKYTEHIHMPEVPPAAMRAVSMLRKDIVLCVSLVLADRTHSMRDTSILKRYLFF